MKRRSLLAGIVALALGAGPAHAIPHGTYDIYIVRGGRVVRMPYFHVHMNPHSQGFKRLMLKARKLYAQPGDTVIYHFEGTYNVYEQPLYKGSIGEPDPYPASTADDFVFPDDTRQFMYPWGYEYKPRNEYPNPAPRIVGDPVPPPMPGGVF